MAGSVQTDGLIVWPEPYRDRKVAVHVVNQLEMDASSERVWAWLIRASRWPEWYRNASHLEFDNGDGPDLELDRRFRWNTFGVRCDSRVLDFEPYRRIAWDAHSIGVDACHAWSIEPTLRGCLVVTEEVQNGWLAWLGNRLLPNRMHKFHQIWLESLAKMAKSGAPGRRPDQGAGFAQVK